MTRVLVFALALLVWEIPRGAAAEENIPCDEMDLSSEFQKIPVRNQGNFGTCYAESVATLTDYWRCKKNPELCKNGLGAQATSSLALSAAYQQDSGRKTMEGGETDRLILLMQRSPPPALCTQSEVAQKSAPFLVGNPVQTDRLFDDTSEKAIFEMAEKNPTLFKQRVSQFTFTSPYQNNCKASGMPLDLDIPLGMTRTCVAGPSSEKTQTTISQLFSRTCPNTVLEQLGPIQPNMGYLRWEKDSQSKLGVGISRKSVLATMDYEFSNGRPFIISTCSELLTPLGEGKKGCAQEAEQELHRQFQASGPMKGDDYAAKVVGAIQNQAHAVTVVGRKRASDGTCKYLIRNSWGPDCGLALPCGSAGIDGPPSCCMGKGLQWVSASALRANTQLANGFRPASL